MKKFSLSICSCGAGLDSIRPLENPKKHLVAAPQEQQSALHPRPDIFSDFQADGIYKSSIVTSFSRGAFVRATVLWFRWIENMRMHKTNPLISICNEKTFAAFRPHGF